MDRGDQPFADLAAGIQAVVCAACAAKDRQIEELHHKLKALQSEESVTEEIAGYRNLVADKNQEIAELRKWVEDGRAAEKRKDEEIVILNAILKAGQAEGNRLQESIKELKASRARKDRSGGH